MSKITIPPHYNDRFITQRYNRALHFVQNLPASSNFQPSKSQKLQLYALYKQVSVGDVNTQRPGLFDVVGRAKWDAWNKLKGISILEARHMYVEALLKCATEAYKKNMGREEAQRIIRALALMKPSDDEEDLLETDDDTSIGSDEAEEKAYLRDIEETTGTPFVVPDTVSYDNSYNTTLRMSQKPITITNQTYIRPESAASIQTMVTAPTTRPSSAANNIIRPRSTHIPATIKELSPVTTTKPSNNEEELIIDDSINPWQQIPPAKPYYPPQQTPTINRYQQQDYYPPSPMPYNHSASSSVVTATPRNRMSMDSSSFVEYTATVSLGPATKRALEALQKEVIALNDRIDDLRKELVESDLKRRSFKPTTNEPSASDGWKWILKVVLKYAGINLATAFILFLVLYKSKSPIAFAILKNVGLLKKE